MNVSYVQEMLERLSELCDNQHYDPEEVVKSMLAEYPITLADLEILISFSERQMN